MRMLPNHILSFMIHNVDILWPQDGIGDRYKEKQEKT